MRIIFLLLALSLWSMPSFARNAQGALQVTPLCSGLTTTGTSPAVFGLYSVGEKTFQATVTGSGSVAATVVIEVSNNPTSGGWVTMGTITLPSTSTTVTDGFASQSGWGYYRCNVTAISGTSATVRVDAAQE